MSFPKIGDHPGIDRKAAEVVQQDSAMRRGIGTDALEADQIVVAEILGRPFTGSIDRTVVEKAPGCRG